MFEGIKNIFKDKDSYTLKEYLNKDENGITLLETLLKEGIELDYKEEKKLKNSIEACYLYVKYNKDLYNFELTEEQLYTNINGQNLIEHIINSKCFGKPNIIKLIKNNVKIVDIIMKKDNYLLSYLSDEIKKNLVSEDINGEYLIEKYFDDNITIINIIQLYNNPKDLIKVCNEKDKMYLLKFCNETSLMTKINKKETLLDYLLSKNIIPDKLFNIPYNDDFIRFIASRNLYNFFKNNSEYILNVEIEKGKTLLEILIDKGLLNTIAFYVSQDKTIEVLYKKNKLELINKVYCELLNKNCKEFNIKSDVKLVDYLLDNNYNFKFYESFTSKEEETKSIIDILYKRKEFDIIGKSLEGKHLLYEVEEGNTILDKLLEENVDINFGYSGINSIEIVKKIFNKNRLDLLVKADLNLLLNIVNEKETYLDYVLDAIEAKKIKLNLNDFSFYNCSVNTIAKFYLKIASHGMMEYVKELKEKNLLKKYNGKMLLEELLDIDKDLTLNKILSEKVKSKIKIATILKSKGIVIENADTPLKDLDVTSDYLRNRQMRYGIGPLYEKGDYLLNKLQQLFLSDGKSDKDLVMSLVCGYRQALITNYDVFIKELELLIKIKEKHHNMYYIKTNNGGYFKRITGSIYSEEFSIGTMLHETGHALHYYLTDYKIPDNFEDIINEIRNNKEILKNAEIISNNYFSIKENIMKLVEVKYNDYFKGYYTIEKNNEIIEFLLKSKEEKKNEFKDIGIDEDTLDIILNETFTSEEYIKTQKRLFIKEQVDVIIREEYGNIMAVSDFLDGIFEGELRSGILENDDNGLIKSSAGHGISYYSCRPDSVFKEMVANFSSISKSRNDSEGLKLLKYTIGDELYNLISDFYYNNIIYKQEEKNKTL